MKKHDKLAIKEFIFVLIAAVSSHNVFAQRLEWAGLVETGLITESRAVSTDQWGNVYIAGYFEGPSDFDPGAAEYNMTPVGLEDVFILKLNHKGEFLWAKQMGGLDRDYGWDLTVDQQGNIYTTGSFSGTVDFNPGVDSFKLTSSGNSDIFISKLDSSGNFVWAIGYGYLGNDRGFTLEADDSGNLVVAGVFLGTADFDPGAGTRLLTSAGGTDVFICKLTSAGKLIWAQRFGGTFDDHCNSLAVDRSGRVHTTGWFGGTADFDPGPGVFTLTGSGSADAYVSALNSAGQFLWAKQIGGASHDLGRSVTVDTFNNVYVAGGFRGTVDFDPGNGVFNLVSIGMSFEETFLLKLNRQGDFVWAKHFSGDQTVEVKSVVTDLAGNAYMAGLFSATADFDPDTSTYNMTSLGYSDAFFVKLNSSGKFKWAMQLEGDASKQANDVFVDAKSNVYGTGYTSGKSDFDPGPSRKFLTGLIGYTGYVFKLNQCMTPATKLKDTVCFSYRSPSGKYTWYASGSYLDTIEMPPGSCDSLINVELIIGAESGVTRDHGRLRADAVNASYQWLDCDQNYSIIPGAINRVFTPAKNGNYAAEIVHNGCIDTTACFLVANAGRTSSDSAPVIDLFPNPTNGPVKIDLGNYNESITVTVRNAYGQIVFKKTASQVKHIELNIDGLPGVYFVQCETSLKNVVFSVIKNQE